MIQIQPAGITLRPLRDTATVPTCRWFLATRMGHESNYKQESAETGD